MRLPRKPPTAAPINVPATRLPALRPIRLPMNAPVNAPPAVPPTSLGPESAEHAATLDAVNRNEMNLIARIRSPQRPAVPACRGRPDTGRLRQNSVRLL